jgi:hypothetical protein
MRFHIIWSALINTAEKFTEFALFQRFSSYKFQLIAIFFLRFSLTGLKTWHKNDAKRSPLFRSHSKNPKFFPSNPYHNPLRLIFRFELSAFPFEFSCHRNLFGIQPEENLGKIFSLTHFSLNRASSISLSVNHGSSQCIQAFIICWTSPWDISQQTTNRRFIFSSSKAFSFQLINSSKRFQNNQKSINFD